jgi:hypothetical protein
MINNNGAKSFVVMLALAGCVDAPPPTPSPARQKLDSACQAGELQACQTVADIEQRERERRSAIPMPTYQTSPAVAYQMPMINSSPAISPAPLTSGQKVCPNGMIVSAYYVC